MDSHTSGDAAPTPHATPASNKFAMRCYIMAIVWVGIGIAVAYYSHNQRMLLIEVGGGLSVIRNEQGMFAGYCSMAFGALWLVVGIVSGIRSGSSKAS